MKTDRVSSTISQQFSVITGDLVSISLPVTVEISAVLSPGSRALSALVTLSALSPPLSLPPPLTHSSMHCCLTKFTEVILLEVTLFVLPTEVWMTEIYTGCSGPENIHFIY